jgi:glycosyltransferase involved in cell wall biosynthesis
MRPFRFAIHLREFGWEPTVLTIGALGATLTEKEQALLRGIRILTVDPPFDRTTRSESHLGGASSRSTRHNPGSGLLGALDRQLPIDSWYVLFAARFSRIVRMAAEADPDVIWATGDPWSGLVVGRRLSNRLGVPYVADFRDPWTLSEVRMEGRWRLVRWFDRRSERRIIASADLVMFQAERVEAAYRQAYAALDPATVTIRNSFDPDVFDDPIEIEVVMHRAEPGELHVGFFGRFRAMSPATLVIDVLADMHRRHVDCAGRVFVHSFGSLRRVDAEHARACGVESQFVSHRPVPLQESLAALRAFDVLLLSTDARRDRIIPAKLFEYLPAGRPILSLSRNPEVADILLRTGTGIQLEKTAAVADLLAASVRALDRGEPLSIPFDPKPDEISRHDARAATGRLAHALDELVGHGSAVPSNE